MKDTMGDLFKTGALNIISCTCGYAPMNDSQDLKISEIIDKFFSNNEWAGWVVRYLGHFFDDEVNEGICKYITHEMTAFLAYLNNTSLSKNTVRLLKEKFENCLDSAKKQLEDRELIRKAPKTAEELYNVNK